MSYIYTPGMPQNIPAALNLAFLAVQELNLLDLHQLRALLGSFHLARAGCLSYFCRCKFDPLPAASSFLFQTVGKVH